MNKIDPAGLPAPANSQTTSTGTTEKKGSAAALQSAQTVVAKAERKKAAIRVESAPVTEQSPDRLSDKESLAGAATDAAIGSPTAGQTPETSTIAPDKDAVTAASIGTRPPAQHESHQSVNLALRRSYRSSTKRPDRSDPDKEGDEGAAPMLGAIAFEVTGKGNEADNALGGSDDPARDTEIAGTGDCVPYLAMVSLPGTPLLRPPKLATSKTVGKSVGKSGPKSRAECERRCGAQGFCDASSDLGCGGIYCGRRNDGV